MARHIEIETGSDSLTLTHTRWGRLVAALYRGLWLFPLVMLGLMVVFMPDYVFRFAEEEPLPGLYWAAYAALALLVAALASTLRYLRSDQWKFDGSSRVVAAEVSALWGEPGRGEADLRDVEAFSLARHRWPKKSELKLHLESGEQEVVFARRGGADELEAVADEIMEFMRRHRYHVELRTVDDHDED